MRAYDYRLGQVHEDYRGDKVVEVQPEDFEVNLDYAATSLSVIFNQVTERIQRIELVPQEATHRVDNKRYLAIYYKTSGDYQKLDPADWEFAHEAATGRIIITFPNLLTAYEVKIHCLFDDRDKDYLPVKKRGTTSEFANLARSMVRVYRVYERRYEDYIYDRNGNRISETITTLYPRTYGYTYYPNSDRLKTRESSDGTTKWAFVYDNNGNLVEKGNTYTISGDTVTFTTSGEGVVYWQYEYDVFNRLVSVKKNGVTVSRYVYDPSGLRIVKEAAETKIYDYDLAGNVIGETNVTNGKTFSYVWVSGRHLARVDGVIGRTGEKYFYECDHLGSPMVVTDDSGNVVWRGDYAPFGEKIKGEVEAGVFVDTHGFTGKDWDEDVGLYYFNARWYDPELGRFVEEDSNKGDYFAPLSLNIFTYCVNNPIINIDPDGHSFKSAFFDRFYKTVYEETEIYIDPIFADIKYASTYTIEHNALTKAVKETTTQTFVNSKGDIIRITTVKVGDYVTQSYSIESNGKIIKQENISYKTGVKNQRNIVAVEGFVSDETEFDALLVVIGREGALGAFQGSTVPQDQKKYATIKETEIGDPYEIRKKYHGGEVYQYPAFQLWYHGENKIPVVNDRNPLTDLPYATGINIHAGKTLTVSSKGCQNIYPGGEPGKDPKPLWVRKDPNDPKSELILVPKQLSRSELEKYWPLWVAFYDLMLPEKKSEYAFIGYYYLTRL